MAVVVVAVAVAVVQLTPSPRRRQEGRSVFRIRVLPPHLEPNARTATDVAVVELAAVGEDLAAAVDPVVNRQGLGLASLIANTKMRSSTFP